MSRYSDLIKADSPLIYLPLDAEFGVNDQSGNGRNGAAAGGVTIGGATGPGELKGTDFDGTDDRVTTAYLQRRNLVTNPSVETNLTSWDQLKTTANTLNDFSRSSGWASIGTWSGHYKVTSNAASSVAEVCLPNAFTGAAGFPVTAGVTYTVRARLNVISKPANGQKLGIAFLDGSNNFISPIVASGAVGATGESTLTATGVAPLGAVSAIVVIGNGTAAGLVNSLANGEVTEFYADAVLLEAAGTGGTYFDGSTDTDSGWEGTAHASVSSKGVFVPGATRSFEWWFNRDDTAAVHTLLSGDGAANNPFIRLSSGSNDLVFSADSGGASVTWASAWIASGAFGHGMVVYDGANAKLLVNGALISSQVYSAAYNTGLRDPLIGARIATTDPANGKLAHVAIYNGDKSAVAGIHYNAGIYQLVRGVGPAPWYSAA